MRKDTFRQCLRNLWINQRAFGDVENLHLTAFRPGTVRDFRRRRQTAQGTIHREQNFHGAFFDHVPSSLIDNLFSKELGN
jgi:hypothetical protein